MSENRMLAAFIILALLAISCGNTASPAELIIGSWNAENMGETRSLEFRSDGTILPAGEVTQHYEVIDGDPDLLRISGMNGEGVLVELELTFSGDDQCTLSGRGITAVLTRVQ